MAEILAKHRFIKKGITRKKTSPSESLLIKEQMAQR